ncbi:MAG: autotransporter-associated beta strand repeat-containing protein [Kiritimatiellia bacterium]
MKNNRRLCRILWILPLAALTARGATNQFNLNGGDYATPGNWSLGSIPGNANNDQPWIGYAATRAATYGTATGYTTTGRFVVGISAGGNGTLTLNGSAGTLTFGGDNFNNANYVGVDGGAGTMNVNAGTLTLTSGAALRIGSNGAGANGTLNIGGGSVNMSADVYVARASASANVTGALNVTAGALNMASNTIFLSSGTNGVANDPAGGTGGTASLSVSGGTLTAWKIFGGAATGSPMATISVSGTGIINAQEYIMGLAGSTATGTQTGGTVNITGGGTFFVGAFSGGTYNLTGGTVNIPAGELRFGHGAGGVGRFTLGGTGVLITPKIMRNLGAGTFNFDGGTLKPAVNSSTFMTGLTAANVLAGGANIDTGGFDITIGQPLLAGSPGGGLTKTGTGTLTLSGGNTYTGATAVNDGILELSGSGTISTSSTINIASGTTLRLSRNDTWGAHNATTSSPIVVNAGGTLASNGTYTTIVNPTLAGGTILLNGGALPAFPAFAIKGTLTVSGAAASNINAGTGSNNLINIGSNVAGGVTIFDVGDVTLSTAADLTINAPLKNNLNVAGNAEVASGLTKTGAGTLLLTGANTYSGTTAVNAGTLVAQGGAALPDSSVVAMGNLAGVALQTTHSEEVGLLSGGGALGGNISLASGTTLTTGNQGGSASYGGIISGVNAALNKRGGGTQTLTGPNTFSGPVTINSGTLGVDSIAVSGAQPLGTSNTPIAMLNGATLQFTGLSGTTGRPLSLSTTNGGQVDVTAGTLTLTGPITGSAANLTKRGAGTFNQSGSGEWSSHTFIAGGVYNVTTTGVILDSGVIELTDDSVFNIGSASGVRASALNVISGTVNLNAGTLRTNGITLAAGTAFNWNTGTLTMQTEAAGDSGTTDRRAPGSSASAQPVYEGRIITIDGAAAALSMPSGGTLNLGPTYGSLGMRYDQLKITGPLDLTTSGNTLNFEFNPHFFRPSTYGTDAAGTLILVDANSFTGTFENFTGVVSDYLGFTAAPGSGSIVGALGTSTLNPLTSIPQNTYYLEYETGTGNILFHYRLTATIPEPASAALMGLGVVLLRILKGRRVR